jgi:DNA invertase Pin-like site-specific DNA recombinase
MPNDVAPEEPLQKRQIIGYARLNRDEAHDSAQLTDLRATGCTRIYQDADGAITNDQTNRTSALRLLAAGDTLVVTRLDRLGFSTRELLVRLEDLQARGVFFRSVHDLIDTATAEGLYALNILGSVVQLERSLLSERTKKGVHAARQHGRLSGNPGLREGRADAIRATAIARRRSFLASITASSPTWLPVVQQLRPEHSWDNVVEVLNRQGQQWTVERLRRAVRVLIDAEIAPPELASRTSRRSTTDRTIKLVAAIALANPTMSLRAIAAELDLAGVIPARGKGKWQASSVRHFLEEARRFGLLRPQGIRKDL